MLAYTYTNKHAHNCSYSHLSLGLGLHMFVIAGTNLCTAIWDPRHTHTYTHTQIKLDWAVTTKSSAAAALAGFFRKGVRVDWKLQLVANRGLWWVSMRRVFTHTPAPPRMVEAASTAESTQPFCNTSRNSPSCLPPLSVWGIDEVVPLSEFAVISPGS